MELLTQSVNARIDVNLNEKLNKVSNDLGLSKGYILRESLKLFLNNVIQ